MNQYRRVSKEDTDGYCDTVGELTMSFAFVFANVSVEQESPPNFYFILRKGLKSTTKTFEMFSWVRGVDYRKGRY